MSNMYAEKININFSTTKSFEIAVAGTSSRYKGRHGYSDVSAAD